MYKVQEYINLHYREKINLGDVADYVFLSKSYLSKIFKDEMKCNLTNYINKLRVEKSKTFLLRNNVSLVDIANSVGFDDQSYFTKVFKKVTGISPGKYRETHGNIVA
jgi:two-component system, response regulator YesN